MTMTLCGTPRTMTLMGVPFRHGDPLSPWSYRRSLTTITLWGHPHTMTLWGTLKSMRLMGYPFDYNLLGVPSWLWHYGVPSHYDIMRNPEDNEINKGKPLWPWSYRGTLTTMTLRGTVMTMITDCDFDCDNMGVPSWLWNYCVPSWQWDYGRSIRPWV